MDGIRLRPSSHNLKLSVDYQYDHQYEILQLFVSSPCELCRGQCSICPQRKLDWIGVPFTHIGYFSAQGQHRVDPSDQDAQGDQDAQYHWNQGALFDQGALWY